MTITEIKIRLLLNNMKHNFKLFCQKGFGPKKRHNINKKITRPFVTCKNSLKFGKISINFV